MNKIKKVLFVFVVLLTLSGCTKQFKSADGAIVRDKKTKQVLIENVLCKPVALEKTYNDAISKKKKSIVKLYEDGDLSKKDYKKKINNILDISKLPDCTKIKVYDGKYENLWTTIFVKPLAWGLVKVGSIFGNYGLSIIIITFLIRLVLFPVNYKTLKQSENMKKAQPKLKALEKKYANKTDQQSMMMKSNEMMAIYKEYKINPLSGCIFGLIQIPLFFAFYEALNRLPILFEGKFLSLNMGMTPMASLEMGRWYYLILPILVGLVTYFSFKMNKSSLGAEQEKQMKMMFNIMIVMIFITSFSMSTAIIIYWITNSTFTILQNLLVKRSN